VGGPITGPGDADLGGALLAVLHAGRSDPRAATWAASRARELRARLTLMCVWRPSALVPLAWLVNVDAQELVDDQEQMAARWLSDRLEELPHDVSVIGMVRRGPVPSAVAAEKSRQRYDELLVDGEVSRRLLPRLAAQSPGLRILVYDPPTAPDRAWDLGHSQVPHW